MNEEDSREIDLRIEERSEDIRQALKEVVGHYEIERRKSNFVQFCVALVGAAMSFAIAWAFVMALSSFADSLAGLNATIQRQEAIENQRAAQKRILYEVTNGKERSEHLPN